MAKRFIRQLVPSVGWGSDEKGIFASTVQWSGETVTAASKSESHEGSAEATSFTVASRSWPEAFTMKE